MEDFEKKQKKEADEYQAKIESLSEEQEKTRKVELERLINKYERIKKDLSNIQDCEKKAIEKDTPIVLNDPNATVDQLRGSTKNDRRFTSINEKKKALMHKISKLDYLPN